MTHKQRQQQQMVLKIQKAAQKEADKRKKGYKVDDLLNVNYCPWGKHNSRTALVVSVESGGYKVQFTSTKGETCDGGVRKPYKRKGGKRMVLTQEIHTIKYDRVL